MKREKWKAREKGRSKNEKVQLKNGNRSNDVTIEEAYKEKQKNPSVASEATNPRWSSQVVECSL